MWTAMRLIRSARTDLLREWLENRVFLGLVPDPAIYFGKDWRGSVKSSFRELEKTGIRVSGSKEIAVDMLAKAFHVKVISWRRT